MFVPAFESHPIIERIALVSLILNGINLLPILPLVDGGWILHGLVFSRHYVLEAAFQVFAGLALISATLAGRGKLWMFLGILLLVSVPLSYRIAKLTPQVA
jgi:Zn-dependent protease